MEEFNSFDGGMDLLEVVYPRKIFTANFHIKGILAVITVYGRDVGKFLGLIPVISRGGKI